MATATQTPDTSDSESVDFSTIDFETLTNFGEQNISQVRIKRPYSTISNVDTGKEGKSLNINLETKRTRNEVSDKELAASGTRTDEISQNRMELEVNNAAHHICTDCSVRFSSSYLLKSLCMEICDECKEKDKYKLITATDVRQKYHLTERHMRDESTGKLSCIEKRNPLNKGWSRMKLYLELQVKEKAHAVWGGEDGVEKEARRRRELSHKLKRNKYAKEIKKLKASVKIASATFRAPYHEHSYGNEDFDTESEQYQKTCTLCGFVLNYEKL